MSERDELLASEMIAARLRDPNFQDAAAVARTRDTGVSNELIQDMKTMNDVEIRAKYGDPAYRAAMRMGEGSARIERIDRGDRTTGEFLTDSATGAAGAAYRTFGNLAGIGAGYMVDWLTDGEIPREQATADILSEHNRNVEGFLQDNLTTQIQDRTRLFQIEGELDKMDNQAVYEREVQEGADPFMAALRREGRNALESAERAWNSPDVTGQIISEGIGDLALSVPLAGAGGLIAKGATTALVRNTVAQRAAQAAGISAGAAVTEVSGVYAETVNDVMSIPMERLAQTSSVYNALLAEGFSPEDAQLQLAGMAAETAAIRQIAPSLALGFITSRFEAMPIGSFRGVGVTKGLLSIAGEGIEEAGQGASGTINRNLSVEEYAQIGRGALEGVGEEAALGAIAGMGVAGVMAGPAATRGTAQTAVEAANALFSETTYNDPLRQDILGGSVASRAAQTVADVVRPATQAASTVVSAGVEQASKLAGRVGQEIVEYTNKPTDQEVVESVQATVNATESMREVAAKGQLRDVVQTVFDSPDPEIPSEGLADVAGGSRNVFENVTGIVAKMGSKGFKATDADTAYAAAQFQKLQGLVTSLPKQAQKEFGKVLSSKMIQNVVSKASSLNLNKEGAPTDVATVRNVAKVNPTAVNPDATDLILEQSGEQISPEDTKLMKAASKLARIVNRNVEAKIQISRTENVNLTASGRPAGKEKTITDVSRQIFADGMVSEGGKKLRSINDFVREIFTGIQSPDGTVINQQGRVQSVTDVMKDMQNFAQHMVNKVQALNASLADGYVTPDGKRAGRLKDFDSPVRGVRREGVRYSPGNPNSVAFAQQVAEDQNAVVDAFNTLREEFPEILGSFPKMEKVELAKPDTQPTGIEEEVSPETFDEQNQQTNQETQTPTANEEESSSERVETEEGAQATSEVETNEEVVSDEPIPSGAKWDEVVSLMTEAEKARMRETVRERLGNARSFIKGLMPTMNKYVKQIRITPIRSAGLGHAFFADQTIHIREDGFNPDGTLNALGKAILVHEVGHLVDTHGNPVGRPYSSARTFYKGGQIFNEMNALRGKMSGYFNNRLEYAFTRNTPEKIASELFAVATEMAFSTEEFSGELGYTAALMEEVYGDLIQTQTTGTTADVSSEETEASNGERDTGESEGGNASVVPGTTRKVTALFNKSFTLREGDPAVTSLEDFMQKFGTGFKMNREYLTIMNEILPDFVQRMNARLKMRVKDGQITKTIAQHIKDGRVEFRKFKAGALMSPETERYDENMLNLAVLAVMDFIATAAASDPRKLDDTLEKMGLSKLDLTEEGMNKLLFGIPPSQLSDTIADDLKRLWHIKENEEIGVDDLEGVTHGFAKEILTVLAEMDIIDIDTVKVTEESNQQDAATILVNTEKMSDYQKRIASAKGEGISNTVREMIFNENRESYSIGEKIPTVSVRKGRGTGIMSALERMAVRRMQDIPHRLQLGRARLLEAIGENNLAIMLGYRDPETVTHPVLKRSVLGKNASVRRDLIEVTDLVSNMMEQQASEVFFPVGVTKVGRHQMQGPNPQNNKLMRYVVAPQRSVLSTTDAEDIQAFWLGVLQQADLYKAEKKNREDDFRAAQEAFADQYGPAVQMVKDLMTTGEFDSDAFLTEVGQVEPAVLAAIEAVAGFELAVANGEATFETALSFELDGLTNGAANMMINFGHGLMTPEDWGNFQRVGYFLGQVGKTMNQFFANKERDLYEMVSQVGDQMMSGDLKFLKPWQKEQRLAAGRLATAFGNFEMLPNGDFKMTRNTAKNPMTKVNYGSGVQGVAVGLADDMLLEFYEKLQLMPENADWNTYFYPGVLKDMETLGLKLPKSFDKNFVFSNDQVEAFRKSIQFTVGKVLTNATRQVLGHRIEQLNDMLVLSTNIQSKYLQKLFDREINALAEKLAKEGVIKRNKKGEPNKGEIPRKYFKELEDRLGQMGAIFVSDEQTLAVGGFEKKLTDLRLSSNFDEKLVTPARMRRPDDVGVRALPFAVIGTGDAMMMNLIFGADNAPNDVLPVFDGIDVPVSKIKQYAPQINEAVLKSWDRDVLGMAVQNFEGFMSNNLEADILNDVWAELMKDNKKESLQFFQGPEDLQAEMAKRLKENRARKKVFRQMAVSVDQMGGSNVGFTREGESWTLSEVNHRIEKEINNDTKPKDVKKPVEFTTAKALLDNMRNLTPDQKKALEILKPLMGDVRVIFGTLDQLNEYRQQNFPDDGVVLKALSNYDFKNNVMFMSTDTNEAILHEMVHAATYEAVLRHYQGVKNDAVARLEVLMNEFMDIQSDGKAMNEAQAAIARRMARNDPVNQAAAVNEFMAYVLTNSRVRSVAKQTNILANFGSKVIALLRKMLGGMPTSMYDHVVFNTRVLNEQNVSDGGNGNTPPTDDPGDETSDPFENHSDYWIENLKAYMRSFVTDTPAKQKTGRDIYNAEKVISDLRQGGLLSNSKDRSTFKAIYGIMLSNMKLDATARIALTRVFQHVVENMTPDMFGSTPEDRQTYSAVLNSFGSIENEGTSDAAAVLFALSQTSKKFRAVLNQIPAPEGEAAVEGSLVDFLTRAASFSMKKLMGSLNENNAPQEVLDAVAQVIIDHDKEKEFRLLKRVTESLTAADNMVSGALSSTSDWMLRKDQEIQAQSRGKVIPFLMSSVTLATNLLDKKNTDLTAQGAKKITHMGLPILSIVPIREMVTEIVGTDKQNSAVVALLNKVNAAVSGMRQAYREDLPGILEREFITAPTKEQWKAMYNTLAKTDFSALVDLDNMRQTMKFLEESATRRNEIQRIEQDLAQSLSATAMADVIAKSKQLADFMNGQAVGKLLVRNAYAIIKNLDGEGTPDMVAKVDRLVSVYAIDRMDPQTREEVVQLWQNDPKGVTSMVAYIQSLNEAEEAKPGITEQARLNGYKGYIPNEGRKNTQIVVDLDSNKDTRERMGYVKLDIPYQGETDSIYPRSYYVSTVRRQGAYSQGVMQNVAMTYRGVDTNTGMTVGNSVAGLITGDSSVDRILQDQLNPNTVLENEQEALMPVFAGDGSVLGFERSISNEIQELHFGRDENLAVMLGAWAGRQVEESLADQYNKQLVDELHKIWETRERGTDVEFEDMKRSTDKIYQESWKLIPQSTKSYIESKFDGRFMVPRSMVNLAVGYREPSITDMWSGKSRIPKPLRAVVVGATEAFMGRKAMRWLAASEEALQGAVSTAKDIIVIRSLVVPVANIQANAMQLANAGVPLKQILKGYREKLAEGEEFVRNRTKIIDLQQKRILARNDNQRQIIDDRIQVLQDLNKQMSIAPMIEAGQFKQLSEGITDLDVDISSGRIGDYIEKLSEKLPDRAADIAKVGLVSKSTKLYQVLNRATQYGDFIAKSIYYDHLISQGLSAEVASAMVNEEFVNFSMLPGRVRSGLESNGLTWFMAFKIRILKIAAKQMRDNPVRSLALNSMTDMNSPISDNILAVIAAGNLDYATGYEMLFDAPELNPWINLLSE